MKHNQVLIYANDGELLDEHINTIKQNTKPLLEASKYVAYK